MKPQKPSILILDNNPRYVTALAAILEASGYAVMIACDSEVAIQYAASGLPVLVLLNLGTADLDGAEICHRIRKFSLMPILAVLTDKMQTMDTAQIKEAGITACISMPFSADELLTRIRAAITETQPAPTDQRAV